MINKDFVCIIPAIKKNAIIPDQLIKRLVDVPIIQWTINLALKVVSESNIIIFTDSLEISLIAERNNIIYHYASDLVLNSNQIEYDILSIYKTIFPNKDSNILIFKGSTPLLKENTIKKALNQFNSSDGRILISTVNLKNIVYDKFSNTIIEKPLNSIVKAFSILSTINYSNGFHCFVIPKDQSIEIDSYQNWWVCEKLLKRKNILFNVIGSSDIGMGHIYRSLSIAHEIIDHNIMFICSESNQLALNKIASTDYHVSVANNLEDILKLNPDIVVNDILDTDEEYMLNLKNNNIKTLNFEDLGPGSKIADITINEIYELPLNNNKRTYWGNNYFFLRNEFLDAKPNIFKTKFESILLLFGGTDDNNLTKTSLESVIEICKINNIKIKIVCGAGYAHKTNLLAYLNSLGYNNIEFHYSIKNISKIMENISLAISSNGRTIFELAHMNIPTIVISSNEREEKHSFSSTKNGFVNLGKIHKEISSEIKNSFEKIVYNSEIRGEMFKKIKKINFTVNKIKITDIFKKLLK